MCGFVVAVGPKDIIKPLDVEHWLEPLAPRGPDDKGMWESAEGHCKMGHYRLSVIDRSKEARQPMVAEDGQLSIVLNGEIYNYLELRSELESWGWSFTTHSDTEVILAAWRRWGSKCVDRFIGMFAFVMWDERDRSVWAVRDRFGQKPLYMAWADDGILLFASEIKALQAAGAGEAADMGTWGQYLVNGHYGHSSSTFWSGITQIPAGTYFVASHTVSPMYHRWYSLEKQVLEAGVDKREEVVVVDDLIDLMEESVDLRFRSDLPVGVALSGGIDSGILYELIRRRGVEIPSFTFTTGDKRYDEGDQVMANIRPERHTEVGLGPRISDIQHMADAQDEPFGGFPTIGMGNVYWSGREAGTPIMLDGVGLDDAAAGYTYYADIKRLRPAAPYITGSLSHGLKPKAMSRAFQEYTKPFLGETGTKDPLLARQLVDLQYLKMPRMLRFNDRAAGMYGCENRSPFLDHRIVEMLMRQPPKHKIGPGQEGKWIVRKVAERLGLPNWNEPKSRKAQTPQREWLVGPLREWTREQVSAFIASCPEWVDAPVMTTIMEREVANPSENNFFLWQWAMAGMYLRA